MTRRSPFRVKSNDRRKAAFVGGAAALLFPVDWTEPFGMVMIEALACGTPVIAMRSGSVPEMLEHGVTGFIVDTVEEAADAVCAAMALNRAAVQYVFLRRFPAERMAAEYVYEEVREVTKVARASHLFVPAIVPELKERTRRPFY